jgi:hypothetical protein
MKFMSVLFLILSPFLGHAEVLQSISLNQTQTEVTVQVEIKNNEATPQRFSLFSNAIITTSDHLAFDKANDVTYLITAEVGVSHISYKWALDLSQVQFLSGDQAWYPIAQPQAAQPQNLDQRFSFHANLLPGFEAVSSATGKYQDSLALVIGRLFVYSSSDQRLKIYLQNEDAQLASMLLTNLSGYLQRFENLYGAYPYDQFSVIESTDEVGYAFPKMTWIGSQLLRYPFILKTSLPHELLHSWWGNGVFVDYNKGNWCEGLTVFGADYGLLSDADKKMYRLKTLTSYFDYVKNGQDIALSQFVERGDNAALQAIGYGKSMFVFVMLEQQLGAQVFQQILRGFYKRFQFKSASWDDFFQVAEDISKHSLLAFKKFWIGEKGFIAQDFLKASLVDGNIQFTPSSEVAKIPSSIIQTHLYFADQSQKLQDVAVSADGKSLQNNQFQFSQKPVSYSIDPDFYLFRNLSDIEMPKSFSGLFAQDSFSLATSNDEWAQAIRTVYKSKMINPVNLDKVDFTQAQYVMASLVDAWNDKRIQNRLSEIDIKLDGSNLTLENQIFDLTQDAVFINIRIDQTIVTLFSLNNQLPSQRWLQRWQHYGSDSYVVLTTQAAAIQGLKIEEDRRAF